MKCVTNIYNESFTKIVHCCFLFFLLVNYAQFLLFSASVFIFDSADLLYISLAIGPAVEDYRFRFVFFLTMFKNMKTAVNGLLLVNTPKKLGITLKSRSPIYFVKNRPPNFLMQ